MKTPFSPPLVAGKSKLRSIAPQRDAPELSNPELRESWNHGITVAVSLSRDAHNGVTGGHTPQTSSKGSLPLATSSLRWVTQHDCLYVCVVPVDEEDGIVMRFTFFAFRL
jgi:hypothetical protein